MNKTVIRTIKVRLYPNKEQKQQIDETLSCCRYVWNTMLERSQKAYHRRHENLSQYVMQNLLPEMKTYKPWLADVDSRALQAECSRLTKAYKKFFKKEGGYPHWKNKRQYACSYTTSQPTALKIEPKRVRLPKIGWIKTRDKRSVDHQLCDVTVIRSADRKYYAAVTYKAEALAEKLVSKRSNILGLDYKSNGLYADSEGNVCNMPHFYLQSQEKLAKQMRILSRRYGARNGEHKSSNYEKQRLRVAKLSTHVANQRRDFLHKQSAAIAKLYDAVAVEGLNMTDMAHSFKYHKFRKRTYDNGYRIFCDMLDYKLEDRGKQMLYVDPEGTTETCSCCGQRYPYIKDDLTIRKWICPQCGREHDRDVNAAINIRNKAKEELMLAAS